MTTKNTLFTLAASSLFVLASCGQKTDQSADSNETTTNEATQTEEPAPAPESKLGAYEGLLGNWTVDAATAGVKMDISFTEDGTFNQSMGENHKQSGTWEVVDDQHIKIVTPGAKNGQTWMVTDLTDKSVNVCWNPNSDKPKTIPFQRAD